MTGTMYKTETMPAHSMSFQTSGRSAASNLGDGKDHETPFLLGPTKSRCRAWPSMFVGHVTIDLVDREAAVSKTTGSATAPTRRFALHTRRSDARQPARSRLHPGVSAAVSRSIDDVRVARVSGSVVRGSTPCSGRMPTGVERCDSNPEDERDVLWSWHVLSTLNEQKDTLYEESDFVRSSHNEDARAGFVEC